MKSIMKKQIPLIGLTLVACLIYSLLNVYLAILLEKIVDSAVGLNLPMFLQAVQSSIVFVTFLATSYFLYNFLVNCVKRNSIRSLRERIINGVFRKTHQDFSSVDTADYISALTNDINLVEDNFLTPLLSIIQNSIVFVATLCLLLRYNYVITIVLISILLVIMILPHLLGLCLQKYQSRLSKQMICFVSKVKDYLSGFEVIKSFDLIPNILKKLNAENQTTAEAKFQKDTVTSANDTVSCLLSSAMQFSIVLLGASLIIRGDMTAGVLVALIQLSSMFTRPISVILQSFSIVKGSKPIRTRLDSISEYQDKGFSGTETASFDHDIVFKDVNFHYNNTTAPAIKNLNLTLEKGKKYAIIGQSGCGKTTMTKLLSGYYSDFSGRIEYDGVDIRDLDIDSLYRLIAIIHQNIYMFNSSILDNVTMYNGYSQSDIQAVLQRSGVDLFLGNRDNGGASTVGENGNQLSGGQRQRIAVARALMKKTPILILDEGTSSLDEKTRYDIENRILQIADLTLITVTHNYNQYLLQQYDWIIVMQDGQVSCIGSYDSISSSLMPVYR